jgi:hypothetical protein
MSIGDDDRKDGPPADAWRVRQADRKITDGG